MNRRYRPERAEWNLYVSLWCAGIMAAFVFAVGKAAGIRFSDYLYPCLVHELTGYYCPGCGGTRAAEALLHGQFLKSFWYHPIVPYTAILLGWFFIGFTLELILKRKIKYRFPFKTAWLWIALAIVAGNFLWKNGMILFCHVHLI